AYPTIAGAVSHLGERGCVSAPSAAGASAGLAWRLRNRSRRPPAVRIPPMLRRVAAVVALLSLVCPLLADDPTPTLLKDIRAVRKDGPASPPARAAWDKLVARGPAVLPQLLQAMDGADTVVANWLRTAFDRIVADARAKGGKGIDTDGL